MDKEQLEVSEDYKKGFNKADMIVTYMPHILKGVKMPEKDETEWDKGFTARVKKYEKDQEMLKQHAPEKPKALKEKDMKAPSKSRDLDRTK